MIGVLSGTHTTLSDGTPAFIPGNNVILNTGSNGAITINTVSTTGTLGTLFSGSHTALANGSPAFKSGSNMSLDFNADGSITFNSYAPTVITGTFSGSHTVLANGDPAFKSGSNVSIDTNVDGSLTFNSYAPTVITGTFSGSHTALADGNPAFLAGSNMTITPNLDGSLTFTASPTAQPTMGRVAIIDDVNGNDSLGAVNGLPFKNISAAISYINAHSLTYVTLFIMPGTYVQTSTITLPATISMRGISVKTCIVTMAATADATLMTMGDNCHVEDLTFSLTSSTNTANLIGIDLPGTTSVTAKLRSCTLTLDNSHVSDASTTNVYAIRAAGAGNAGEQTATINFSRVNTISVLSNGGGLKTGIYLTGTSLNTIATLDTNIYVADPPSSNSTGTYTGVYVDNRRGRVELRQATVSAPTHTSLVTNTAAKVGVATANVTLTGSQTIQGVSLSAGDRVLLTQQTNAVTNGLWLVQTGSWTRASDMATGSNAGGAFVAVEDGDYYAQKFLCTNLTGTVGTESLTWMMSETGFDLKTPVFARYVGGAPTGSLAAQDTYAPVTGDRIFLDQATNAVNNGIWVYNSSGSWTRSNDMSTGMNMFNNHIFVYNGTYASTTWHVTSTGSIGTNPVTCAQTYFSADIQQRAPYVAGTGYGIFIAPGTDLVHRAAGGKPFTVTSARRVITYALQGNIQLGTRYMWPGLQTTMDSNQSFYRVGSDTSIQGMFVTFRTPPGSAVVTVNVLRSISGVPGRGIATPMRASITNGTLTAASLDTTIDLKAGMFIALQVNSTSAISNAAMIVELVLL